MMGGMQKPSSPLSPPPAPTEEQISQVRSNALHIARGLREHTDLRPFTLRGPPPYYLTCKRCLRTLTIGYGDDGRFGFWGDAVREMCRVTPKRSRVSW